MPHRQPEPVLRVGSWSETCDSYRRNGAGWSRQCRRRGVRAVQVAELARSGCRAGRLVLTRRGDPCRVARNTRWCRPWRFTSFTTKPVSGADYLCRGYLPAPVTPHNKTKNKESHCLYAFSYPDLQIERVGGVAMMCKIFVNNRKS